MKPLAKLLWLVVGCLLWVSCAHIPAAKEACASVEVRRQAVELVVPRLSPVAMCVVTFDGPEQRACIEAEAKLLQAMAAPIVYSCALSIVHDAVEGARR